ncbi:hypothetical protein R1flu_025432 [Riccia fluitans]|uniref:Uncharacterized protein n=1 Tax=Riccia fluitans TaxID=41844 RepID=A0ABD1XXQ7_9MARC
MATRSSKDLKVKTKEVKIPHLTNENKKKLEKWGFGGLFEAEWSQAREDLVKELSGHSDQLPSPNMSTVENRRRGLPKCGEKCTTCLRRAKEAM